MASVSMSDYNINSLVARGLIYARLVLLLLLRPGRCRDTTTPGGNVKNSETTAAAAAVCIFLLYVAKFVECTLFTHTHVYIKKKKEKTSQGPGRMSAVLCTGERPTMASASRRALCLFFLLIPITSANTAEDGWIRRRRRGRRNSSSRTLERKERTRAKC